MYLWLLGALWNSSMIPNGQGTLAKRSEKVQRMKILLGDRVLFAQFERVLVALDINTGQDVKKLNGVGYYFESQFSIRAYGNMNLRLFQEEIQTICQNNKFFAFRCSISPDAILISARGATSCYNIGAIPGGVLLSKEMSVFLVWCIMKSWAMFICVTRPNGH